MTAKKALGLESSVDKLMGQEIKKARENFKRTSPITAELPAEPAPKKPAPEKAPVVTAPGTPAAPPAAPAIAAPAAGATPPAPAEKIKIAGKEYTVEELEAELKKQPAAPAAPAPQEEAPSQKPMTEDEVKAAEAKFIADTSATLDTPLSEEQMDTILAGGKNAVSLLQQIRKTDMATSILQARKGIAQALDPIMNQIFAAVKPLVQQHQDLQRYQIKQQFVTKHADFSPHIARAESVAEELVKLYPQQVQKMTQEQFIDEVARQTDRLLTDEHKRWFPAGNGNWRQSAQPAPVAPPTAPVIPAAAPPAPPTARAPVANVPVGGGSGSTPDWRKGVAASLRS